MRLLMNTNTKLGSYSPSYDYDRITGVAILPRFRAPCCQASRALALFVARQHKSVASIRAIRANTDNPLIIKDIC